MGRTLRVALLLAFTLLFAGCGAADEGRFTLVNDSAEEIVSARVEVCSQVSEYGELAPGDATDGTFRVRGDSGYDVSVTFASGRKLDREVGYVTDGLDYEDVITVTDSGVEIAGGPERDSD